MKINPNLKGRLILKSEVIQLKSVYENINIEELIIIMSDNRLIGQCFSLLEKDDSSGYGVGMEWMIPKHMIEESLYSEPGITSLISRYIPIGYCLTGSGDPYFARYEDNQFVVYRILHDMVWDKEFEEKGIEYVCSLPQLISFFAEE